MRTATLMSISLTVRDWMLNHSCTRLAAFFRLIQRLGAAAESPPAVAVESSFESSDMVFLLRRGWRSDQTRPAGTSRVAFLVRVILHKGFQGGEFKDVFGPGCPTARDIFTKCPVAVSPQPL